jgi:endonuclease/exonuclease/phosphatase (EEP) superfamily protein YafD
MLTSILGPPLLAGALGCALAALLAHLGRWSAVWDILTHAAPLYLAGAGFVLATGLLMGAPYRAPVLIVAGVAVLASLALIAPELARPASPRTSPGAVGALKLVQLNAWGGKGGVERIADWLAAEQPDVAVLQETTSALRSAIQARTGMVLTRGRTNVAIFSRDPPIAAELGAQDADAPMMLAGCRIRTGAGEAVILGVHYPWPTEHDRMAQAGELVQAVRRLPSATTVLAGDFNSTPWSFARRREDREFGLSRRTRALFTWPAGRGWPLALLPIDHVYAGAAWATVRVRRGPDVGSDHYPVIVILAPRRDV